MNAYSIRLWLPLKLCCMLFFLHACLDTAVLSLAVASDKTSRASGPSGSPAPQVQPRPRPENITTGNEAGKAKRTLTVMATAYTSHPSQTVGDPHLAAWGDTIKPGMKCIAVSRDLLKMGLKRNTRVRIRGLPGSYVVKDKLHRRWTQRIDIYLGLDVQAARRWGKRKVVIEWMEATADRNSTPRSTTLCFLYARAADRPPAYPFHRAIR